MSSKVTELGVFTLGVGLIFAAICGYVVAMIAGHNPAAGFIIFGAALPGTVMAITGAIVLLTKHKAAVIIALVVSGLLFGLQLLSALIRIDLITIGFSGAVLYVLYNRGRLALREASGIVEPVEKIELPRFDESARS